MKISSATTNHINLYANQANAAVAAKAEKPSDETRGDSVNLSDKTRELQKISAAMETIPDDRAKLVADLKNQVQANLYNVNADKVAEKMIGSLRDIFS